jgi:hypothetical protein
MFSSKVNEVVIKLEVMYEGREKSGWCRKNALGKGIGRFVKIASDWRDGRIVW